MARLGESWTGFSHFKDCIMNEKFDLDTLAVRAGITRSQFGEHSEALYLTSSYVFNSAAEAAARFSEIGRAHV